MRYEASVNPSRYPFRPPGSAPKPLKGAGAANPVCADFKARLDRSNSPQFVWAIQLTVAVMNDGPRKGGPVSVFDTMRKSPGLKDIWQGHLALAIPKEVDTDEQMIANMEATADCKGNLLKASVDSKGQYTITNLRNGISKPYQSK